MKVLFLTCWFKWRCLDSQVTAPSSCHSSLLTSNHSLGWSSVPPPSLAIFQAAGLLSGYFDFTPLGTLGPQAALAAAGLSGLVCSTWTYACCIKQTSLPSLLLGWVEGTLVHLCVLAPGHHKGP